MHVRELDSEMDNGDNGTDADLEKHADEMHMMTWQDATHKQMTWQQ